MNAMPLNAFDPETDARAFRGALGAFATGVTVVTTQTDDGPVAIVANSFASVSLDPPLVLWSPAKASRRFRYFARARRYAIHVLAAGQQAVCDAVLRDMTAIRAIDMAQSACGLPVIEGALASFDCALESTVDAGDHVIVLGRVLRAWQRPGKPLVFHGGAFGELHRAS